jgi:hypothetical protein
LPCSLDATPLDHIPATNHVLALALRFVAGGWTLYADGNECEYKLVNEQVSWFHAVRHCHDDENGSELALVQSEEEARFTSMLGGKSSPRWIFGYFDESTWNVDYDTLNLWHAGQPANPHSSAKHCVVQGGHDGDDNGRHLLSAESCSARKNFVCKICPSQEASQMVVDKRTEVVRQSVALEPAQHHRNRRGASSTTTDAPVVGSTTTTTDAPTAIGDEGGVAAISGAIARSTVNTGSSTFTLATGAIVAIGAFIIVLACSRSPLEDNQNCSWQKGLIPPSVGQPELCLQGCGVVCNWLEIILSPNKLTTKHYTCLSRFASLCAFCSPLQCRSTRGHCTAASGEQGCRHCTQRRRVHRGEFVSVHFCCCLPHTFHGASLSASPHRFASEQHINK